MAPLSLKVVLDEGAVTRTVMFESGMKAAQAQAIVKEKVLTGDDGKEYGLFLTSADDERSGIWLEGHRSLDYYMLRDGDLLHYLCRIRNLRIRMLDGSVKTLQVDESKTVQELMIGICARIGITNHDEYGLCHDEEEAVEEKPAPAGAGTLTLRRVRRERDAKLTQLSKKLKTDDNVEWLDQHKTFREMGIDAGETLLLKRRLFYTDRNVDARDPVGLNLLYVQTRNAVLQGRHPVTEDQAIQFAGIQCQIQYGDYNAEKHKPGFFELHEFLPKERISARGMEGKVLREFSKHRGLSELDAKHLYTKTARDLPTYGVTFFLVKEQQKGKKKLVPRLLGINAESILRLDEVTKEVLQVWPLTQVKTYHAGKSETFTLNFGDYSDKEYCVKTNDAHRIRDILQGYIDIIKKRMDAQYRLTMTEHHAVMEDHVEPSRGHTMEVISQNANKIMQETFVGPSKIVSYEPGQQISQGTQIVTVQQMVVTGKGSHQQNVIVGELPARKDMSMDFVRKLNRLNSNSVKVVTFLTEPSESNVAEARKLVETMQTDMPIIEEGVNATAQKQSTEDAKKKLLDELRELRDCMKRLTDSTVTHVNPEEGQEAARNIADLSTQMYFSLDPRTIKRGEFCRRSRNSFIQDERSDATLRRASFLAAAHAACRTIDDAKAALNEDYQGPDLDPAAVEELEKAAEDKMGKLNAAVALYLTAYADPQNVDYSAAVTSMNTINELIPELVKDAQMLSGVKDGKSRQELLDQLRALCDAAKVCISAKPEDHENLREAAKDYGRASEKLLFTFKRMKKTSGEDDKANELIELSKDVGAKVSLLLAKASELSTLAADDPRARDLDDASLRCAGAADDLLACTTLTAPFVHEAHCRSAADAAAAALAARAQALAARARPLLDHPDRSQLGDDLRDRSLDLTKALDRLKDAFASLDGMPESDPEKVNEGRRLKFITTAAVAKKKMDETEDELNKPYMGTPVKGVTSEELKTKLAESISQLNAALTALVNATADRDKPDYATADLAVATITELMPEIVKDGKALGAGQGEQARAAMLADLKALCDAARAVCDSDHATAEELNGAAAKFANTSGKLYYVFNPRANQNKEHEILDLSSSACEKASKMLASVYQLASEAGEAGVSLDAAGSRVADAANALLTSAQLTAPCISDPRCVETLTSSADALARASQALASAWAPLVHEPRFQPFGDRLEEERRDLQEQLDRLRRACHLPASGIPGDSISDPEKEGRRLQFITTVGNAKKKVDDAETELDKPLTGVPLKGVSAEELKRKMAEKIAQLNAALAALVAATNDRNKPDYAAADEAVATITRLMPEIVKDGKALSVGQQDEKARAELLAQLKALCDATRDVCNSSEQNNIQDLNNAAAKFAKSSGKLLYVFNPRADRNKEHEVVELSSSAYKKASEMLANVSALAQAAGADGKLGELRARTSDAAIALVATAQLTAPCMQDSQCQARLASAADALADANQRLARAWQPIVRDPRFKPLADKLEAGRSNLQQELERLKKALRVTPSGGIPEDALSGEAERRRLQFVSAAAHAHNGVEAAEKELDKPAVAPKPPVSSAELQRQLARALAQLNAAVAALVAATSDRENPDYESAGQAMNTINQILPQFVKDTKSLSATCDDASRAAMLDDARALCHATRGVCAGAGQPGNEELNSAAAKYAGAAGKLVYVFNPRASQDKEHEVLDIASSACEKASQLLSGVYALAAGADAAGAALDAAGSSVADAANALLTTAQLVAPSLGDPHGRPCQDALIHSADVLSAASDRLAATWAPVVRDPRFESAGRQLQAEREALQAELERLRRAARVAPSGVQVKHLDPVQERQRLQFVDVASAADNNLQKALKELDKPVVPGRGEPAPGALQSRLAHALGQLNAALAALLAATADRENPNYDEAEQAIHTINQLMPQVVKETKSLSASKPEAERKAMLDELRALCHATRAVCGLVREGDTKEAAKLASKATGLMYVVNPQQRKHQRITELCESACEKAMAMAARAQALAPELPDCGAQLEAASTRTADAAVALLAASQLVSPTIQEPQSQACILSAADTVHQAGRGLAELGASDACGGRGGRLGDDWKHLASALDELRAAVNQEAAVLSPTRRAPPPPPKRTVSRSISNEVANQILAAGAGAGYMPNNARDANQQFLHMLRCEESQNANTANLASLAAEVRNKRKTDDEKALHQEYVNTVHAAARRLRSAQDDVNRVFNTKDEVIPALSVDQTLVVQKQMEQKLAAAAVAVADLVACNHPDTIDLPTASKSTTTLSEIMPQLVQDAKLLRGSLDENERKSFLADMLALFDATNKLLDSAKGDRTTLDKSAVEFGNKSAKLLYVVSTDVDPSQEKEVLERVRAINESASRVAMLGAAAADTLDAKHMQVLCVAGGKCAEAATALAYTAKLVAPSIQNSDSNEALMKATDNLTTNLQAYSSTWQPLEASQQAIARDLRSEASGLEDLLEGLRRDLRSGGLVRRRPVERVVVEDTPLRQLACVVLEEAKRRAESTNTPADLRVKYAKYANNLSQAIKDLDLANHRCRQASHDAEKRQNLEYAVQNLQVTLLQTRPSQEGRPQNNIVDLTDYVKDIASDADKLKKICKDDQKELQMIKEHCEQISAQASRVMNPHEQLDGTEGAFDDIQEVEQFAEECDKHCNAINAVIDGLPDGKLKIDLQEKATRLSEDCNMLRFATKSAVATSQSVSLDATLDDLTDLEARIDEMLAPGEKIDGINRGSLGAGRGRLVAAASRACVGVAGSLAPAFTAYMDDVRARTDLSLPAERDRSKDHLKKVLHLLRALTMTTSRHVATWQKLGHPDTAEITQQIIKELDDHESHLNVASGKPQRSVLSDVDLNKLLFPTEVQIKGDHKQLSAKLSQAASKLSMATSTLVQSAHRQEALARSAHAAAAAAADLAGLAAGMRTNDLAQSQKIDEATKEMSLQTYNVLKTADVVSQEPNNYAARRRLLDACRLLNDAINKLVRTTSPGSRLQRECGELTRGLQLQQSLLAAPAPPAPAAYSDCIDALHNQADVLQKLNNDTPMSREEFSKTLGYVNTAVCNSTEYAAQCAYLLAVSDQNKEVAQEGFMDSSRIMNLSEAVQETCHRIIRTDVEQAKAEEVILSKQIQDFQQALAEARDKTKDADLKARLADAAPRVDDAAKVLYAVVNEKMPSRAKITSWTIKLVDSVKSVNSIVEGASLAPEPGDVSPDTKAKCDEIVKNTRTLGNSMMSLLREVKASDDADPMTWVTFGTSRKAVLDAFDALLNSVKESGKRAGVLEPSPSDLEEEDAPKKSYVQIQLDLANKWLKRPTAKPDVKAAGENAANNIIQLGEKMAEDLKGPEQEEMLNLVAECQALLADCSNKYDKDKASALMESLKELRKSIERGVVTRVVEDFLEGEEPLADLDILTDAEKDESKRKFLLERKIAELLAHLGRVTKTARLVAGAGGGAQRAQELIKCSDQTELLAPMLVKAAQQRVNSPEDQAAIDHYQKLLAQYAESLANVRSLCDQAVDPMEFVQTAGETMQRMREESNHQNDPQKCAYASMAITKLANRVITVSMSSNDVRRDPELQKALTEAKQRLKAAVPAPNARPSKIPDWKDTTAEILRTTGEVESVLGGEFIFKKQQGSDQPIFAAAFDLHTAVREWSARDNEIVAVAKRMAVLMAKLSDYMNTDRKRELLATSKAIVAESHEVAELARKLAHECTDVRIKTNLLQVCERIPTISGQLKMLATVKGSSLGHQGLKEDQEDMITLVGNAQNLMSSVQEVVKAAASATVKIASQRGARMRWVRKTYY